MFILNSFSIIFPKDGDILKNLVVAFHHTIPQGNFHEWVQFSLGILFIQPCAILSKLLSKLLRRRRSTFEFFLHQLMVFHRSLRERKFSMISSKSPRRFLVVLGSTLKLGLDSSFNLPLIVFLFRILEDWSKSFVYYWHYGHFQLTQLFQFNGKLKVFVQLLIFFHLFCGVWWY